MITVGLDFGTHQSKVCVESRDGAELSYSFVRYRDSKGKEQYTLPSIIRVGNDGKLTYGYIPEVGNGRIIRYFKQGAFTHIDSMTQQEAVQYSIWYITYILMLLDERYPEGFAIQMGVPSDGGHFISQKKLATRIILSSYYLIDEVFENDMNKFLSTPIDELKKVTKVLPYNEDDKIANSILVFPEAYACLLPLIHQSKIDRGMSLMVDIGGGTTDISFFTIESPSKNSPKPPSERLHVYDFYSINKGLNFLTEAEALASTRLDSNVDKAGSLIKGHKIHPYTRDIENITDGIVSKLAKELRRQSRLELRRLYDALKSRPIIYTGGGSTFKKLVRPYGEFKDIIHISEKEWRKESVEDMVRISALGLCPILSTAYGLSIGVASDDIKCEPFTEIFRNVRDIEPEPKVSRYAHPVTGFAYEDYDALK